MRLIFTVCFLALFTTACSKAPSQKGFLRSYQHKVQSAEHWQRLADDVVSDQLIPYLKKNKVTAKIYIEQRDRSDFGIAFHTYLTTELFDKKVGLEEVRDNSSVTLEWSVQQVRHNSNRRNAFPGIFVAAGAIATEFLAGGDGYTTDSKVPNSEIIISTKLIGGGKTLAIKTETFYVEDKDTGNYWFFEDNEQELAYVKRGSIVCNNKRTLHSALNDDGVGYSSLNTLKALGDCAVMSQNHPVDIIDNDGHLIVIRSHDDAKTYVTTIGSTSQI